MPSISEQLVSKLETKSKDYFIWDSEVKGFGVKVTPKGTKTFVFQWQKGQPAKGTKRKKIGSFGQLSVEEARAYALHAKKQLNSEEKMSTNIASVNVGKKNPKEVKGYLNEEFINSTFETEDYKKIEEQLVTFFKEKSSTKNTILISATRLFMENGFNISIDSIALDAGLTRFTVYQYFSDKDELINSVVRRVSKEIFEISLPPLNLDKAPFDTLYDYAKLFRKITFGERFRCVFLLAIHARNDERLELVRRAEDVGQKAILDNLANYLHIMMKKKVLKSANPYFLAEQFIHSIEGNDRVRLLFGLEVRSVEEAEKYLKSMVDNFLHGLMK